MVQECLMVGNVYGRLIVLSIYGVKTAHWMAMKLSAPSAAFPH
jgi:hypothetical protein